MSAANGGGQRPYEQKVRITVDLVTAARRHLVFLKSLSNSSFLHHAPTILRSIRRYNEVWMPLISDLSKGSSTVPMLLPPLDVRWVWHCHCLNPLGYREYCNSRFGHLVEWPAIFDDENEEYASSHCRDIWDSRYPSEPFDLETTPEDEKEVVGGGGGDHADISSPCARGDLFAVVVKYLTLYSIFSDPFVAETVYLVSARQRYKCFLHLCRQSTEGSARMVPTSDILLMWLTHQSFPGVYAQDMEGIMGAEELGSRVVGFGERAGEREAEETTKIWEQAFDEPYERAGAGFDPVGSPSRAFFYWEDPIPAAAAESNRKYKVLQPRSVMEARLIVGRKLQFQVKDACLDSKDYKHEEQQFVTLIRFTQENPNGRATALLNWRLLAVEFLPEEDAVFILLLCMAILRTISEIHREDLGHLLVRRRVKEAKTGNRDWGSVMLPPGTCSSPHLKPWFWNPKKVLVSAEMDEATFPGHRYSPADGKDELFKQGITLSR